MDANQFIEMQKGINEWTLLVSEYFRSLTDQGLNGDQALALTIEFQRNLFGMIPKGNAKEDDNG